MPLTSGAGNTDTKKNLLTLNKMEKKMKKKKNKSKQGLNDAVQLNSVTSAGQTQCYFKAANVS